MVLLLPADNKGGSGLPSIYKGLRILYKLLSECLIRKSYFQDKFFANPHVAFENKNCPKDTEGRVSIEMRVALFF